MLNIIRRLAGSCRFLAFHFLRVFAEAGSAIAPGRGDGTLVARLTHSPVTFPGFEHRSLQSTPVGKTQLPRRTAQGRFIALRCSVASTSLCPPERKTIPGTAAGPRVSCSAKSLQRLPAPKLAAGNLFPKATMFGFNSIPSSATRYSAKAWKTICSVCSVTSKCRSIVCAPSMSTSGSTIGTRSASWLSAA